MRATDTLASRLFAAACALLFLLASCGQPAPVDTAGAHQVTLVFDARSASWRLAPHDHLEPGTEFRQGDALYRVTHDAPELVGHATSADLAAADQQWAGQAMLPGPQTWVRTVDGPGRHLQLHHLDPGARFAWRGRIFETRGSPEHGIQAVRATGEVVQRVVDTVVRTVPVVLDLELAYPDGTTDALTATPDHPFWLPDLGLWSEIGQVEPGTALLTRDGDRAVLERATWRDGEFEVFNFTVDNRHNYFVAGSEQVPGALVHNCPEMADGLSDVASGAADKWSRSPKSLQDQMTLDAAKEGAGEKLISNLGDPKYKGMDKMEYKVKSENGRDSVVHYVRDPETGQTMDFKFKKHSTEGRGKWESTPDPSVPSGG